MPQFANWIWDPRAQQRKCTEGVLDVVVQKQVMKTLKTIQKNLQCGMILIGHDLGLITQFCDDVVVLYEGRIVEFGSVKEITQNPKNSYTQHLINSLPKFDFQNA